MKRFLALALLPAAVGLVVSGRNAPVVARMIAPPGISLAAMADSQIRGVGSCAAAACHNAYGAPGSKGSEFTTWITGDQHANAFGVLRNEKSLIIERNLRGLNAIAEARPEKDALCLKCHASEIPGIPTDLANDGVGCESCHGPAGQWLTIHYLDEWKTKSDEEKRRYGMAPTKNLYYRMKMCAECHIGSEKQEVNHDLIAAGHPRLSFEYSSFLAKTAKHWNEAEEKRRVPDLEARTWALGQIASAEAALELLEHRANDAGSPWPEFTEYDCFACHHDLQARPDQAWRQRKNTDRKPGTFPYGTWYFATLSHALETWPVTSDAGVAAKVDTLKAEMQKAAPDRKAVASQARALAEQLRKLGLNWNNVRFNPAAIEKEYNSLQADQNLVSDSWDSAAQRYLGLSALFFARADLTGAKDAQGKASLMTIRKGLAFPSTYDSPLNFKPKR